MKASCSDVIMSVRKADTYLYELQYALAGL